MAAISASSPTPTDDEDLEVAGGHLRADGWFGSGWRIAVTLKQVTIVRGSDTITLSNTDAARLDVRRRWFRWRLEDDGEVIVRLRGLNRMAASELRQVFRHLPLMLAIGAAVKWRTAVDHVLTRARDEQRWIPTETIDSLVATRPEQRLLERVHLAGTESFLTEGQRDAVAFLDTDLDEVVAGVNEEITSAELTSQRSFFDTIEKTPLTEEQARAVVCFDNRVQVLAAAGSGKTSVMVARAAYAVSRGFVAPDKILLLAFNKAAATELQQRVTARFKAAGIDSTGVRASTFHSFGLGLIGRAIGAKPRLARWLEQGEDLRMILRIVDELRDTSESFRYQWDMYRLLFAIAPTKLGEHEPDGYDKATGESGYRTFAGEVVKSHGERLIANFLYLNGVEYAYERPYSVEVADETHSQYRPDFYYPAIDVWHEHWALDRDGRPPTEFTGYAEGIAWKRRLHAQHGTTLVESTWGDVIYGDGLAKFQADLTRLGLTFDWNPDRPIRDEWAKPMKHEDLARFVRTFMAHVKSNSWTAMDLDRRLTSELSHLNGYRTRLFLQAYWPIHEEWEHRLAADGSVDFEDMLVQAAGHLETGRVDSDYELILVDEFQDASRARARLVRGLVNRPGRFLLAVGDDWQAINRFAGADLSVMTNFERWFGRARQLALTTTFRCTQTICDVARRFVSKNPAQFDKPMRSAHEVDGSPVNVVCADDIAAALTSYLSDLSASVTGTATVDVLGRYGFERDVIPKYPPANLHVTFRTVHSAKGLEADYVAVPGMTTGTYGFPSNIADDPVLDLAMPEPESFPHAEERRLFYVALTRARLGVTLISPSNRMSPFAVELLDEPLVTVTASGGEPVEVCPKCRRGTMVQRTGPYGPFLSCSTWPACPHKHDLRERPAGPRRSSRRRR